MFVPKQIPTMTLALDAPTELEVGLRTFENVEVTGVSCEARYAKVQMEPNGDQAYRLKITVGPDAPLGRSDFVMILSTTAEYEPKIPVTVYSEKGIVDR